MVGSKLRGKSGSLVQDIWHGSAAHLAEMGQIAIFPVKGWFASRSFPDGHEFNNCHQSNYYPQALSQFLCCHLYPSHRLQSLFQVIFEKPLLNRLYA